jgi:putative DNA primase/helicase
VIDHFEPEHVQPASRIRDERMSMVWRNRIPAGTLSVIAGKPGLGKSTLGTTIAAELSARGKDVVISNLEDDLASVVKPRLIAAGADLDRVHLIPPYSSVALPRDRTMLEMLLADLDAKVLLLDPIAAHFRPERKVYDRPSLIQLVQVARATGCAIVGIHHTVKYARDPLNAIGGASGGLVGTARAVYLYGHDPNDEDRRALACVKINGVDEPPALVISQETVEYIDRRDRVIEAARLVIHKQSNARSRDVLKPGRRIPERDADCAEWLTLFLAAGEDFKRPVAEIRDEGSAAGYGWQTLVRAQTQLEVVRVLARTGWHWRLHSEHPFRAEAA